MDTTEDMPVRATVMLRDYTEILEQLRIAQDEEDNKFGDMGHSYYRQAEQAIVDLDAALMDEAADHHKARMEAWKLRRQLAPTTSCLHYEAYGQHAYITQCGQQYDWVNKHDLERFPFCPGCGRQIEVRPISVTETNTLRY